MEGFKKNFVSEPNNDIRKIVDESKKNNSAYTIQDYFRRYILRQKIMNTAEKLKASNNMTL